MKNKKKFYCCYTICFLFIACGVFFTFWQEGRSFIYKSDGLQQHFNALVYYRLWLREILKNIFINHKFDIPLWDMNIGYGSDILTTLHYYVIGDPLNVLSVFVPDVSDMEKFFCGMVLVRIYLAGISFSMYAFYHKNTYFPVLIGSLIYVFNFWTLQSFRHPFFLNPLIYFPLILLGVDRIFEEKKPKLYIGMLAVATLSNFYFAYMICLLVMGYVIFVYLQKYKRIKFFHAMRWVGYFIGTSLLGLAMGAVLLVPQLYAALSTARTNVNINVPLLYDKEYYLKFFIGFSLGKTDFSACLGYTVLGTLAVWVLFLKGKKYLKLQIAFLLMTVLLWVPQIGHLFNAGGYVTNREVWAYGMLVAYIVVKMLPVMQELSVMQKRWVSALLVFYLLVVQIGYLKAFGVQKIAIAIAVELVLTFWLVFVMQKQTKKRSVRLYQTAMLCLVGVGIVTQAYDFFKVMGVAEEVFLEKNTAWSLLTENSTANMVKEVGKEGVWRYENSGTPEPKNAAMQNQVNGTSYYFSIANGYISEFQDKLKLNRMRDFLFPNLDSRMALQAITNVNYFVKRKKQSKLVPYGYKKIGEKEREDYSYENQPQMFQIYENKNPLLFGYTCDSYISQKTFQNLSINEREQSLLQGAVLEKSTFPQTKLKFSDKVWDYSVYKTKDLIIKGRKIYVKNAGAILKLSVKGKPNSEIHIQLRNVQFQDAQNVVAATNQVKIKFSGGKKKSKVFAYVTPNETFYQNIHDVSLNLGYYKKPLKKIKVKFDTPGIYSFDDVKITSLPVKPMKNEILKRNEEVLQHVELGTNCVSGNISLKQKKILCLSIPYSKGWSAKVDGKPMELKRSNIMFMALELQPGKHQIKLTYRTPYLLPSIGVSAVAWIIYLFFGKILLKRKKI